MKVIYPISSQVIQVKLKRCLLLSTSLILVIALAGCLNGGDGGGGGGYGTVAPVSDLIIDEDDIQDWYFLDPWTHEVPVESYQDLAVVMIADSPDLATADHVIMIIVFELDGYEGANETFDHLSQFYSSEHALEPLDIGSDGFAVQVDDQIHLVFKKYRYVSLTIYTSLGEVALSLAELIEIAETQEQKITYG